MNDKLTLDKLSAVEKMLTALLKSNDLIHWVGGYVQGRTTPKDDQRIGDPFIILYPASERLNHKICRVYEHDFAKLPDFVDTDVPEDARVDDNPDRDKALKKRVYRPCAPFLITIYEGKETQMGPEKRFLDVVRVSRPKDDNAQTSTPPAPQPSTPPVQPARAATSAAARVVSAPAPAPKPVVPPPAEEPTPEERAGQAQSLATYDRQRQLNDLYVYGKSKGLSRGAVDLELARYNGNPLDTLQALQAEHGERPEPPQHPTVTMQQYWHAVYNVEPRWSQKGGSELLKKFSNNPTLAYQELMSKKQPQPQA